MLGPGRRAHRRLRDLEPPPGATKILREEIPIGPIFGTSNTVIVAWASPSRAPARWYLRRFGDTYALRSDRIGRRLPGMRTRRGSVLSGSKSGPYEAVGIAFTPAESGP